MDRRRLELAVLVVVAVAVAVTMQSNIIAGSAALAQGITLSPISYLPLVFKKSQVLALPTPTPTSVPTPTPTPAVPLPVDLVVTALAADPPQFDAYYAGLPMHLTMTVQNQGLGDAVGFSVHWLPQEPGVATTVVISSGVRLAAGNSITFAWDYTYHEASPFGSAYQTEGLADPTSVITEANETNNSRTLPLAVYDLM